MLEKLQLLWESCLFGTMVIYILANSVGSYTTTNSSSKVSIFPELSFPEFTLYFREVMEYLACRYTLEASDNFCDGISWWKRHQHMYMIFSYFQLLNVIVKLLCNAMEKLAYIFPEITTENPFSILGCPHQMVMCIINCMSSTFCFHADIISQCQTFVGFRSPCSGHRVHRMVDEFIPV